MIFMVYRSRRNKKMYGFDSSGPSGPSEKYPREIELKEDTSRKVNKADKEEKV